MYYTVSLLILIFSGYSSGDIPCNKIKSEAGYVCACNSTYCDTINQPKPLPTGKFHFYHTSAENPGFNYETGHFKMQAFPPYGFVYKVNSTKTYQNVRGFGGSFSDSFGAVHNSLSANAQENLMKSFFSEEGLEYSMCRVVLGSSDFTVRNYTYLPHYDPSMKSFNLTEDDFIYKIDLIKKALSMTKREINLIGSTWTAPSWMKKNNDSIAGYIKDEFRQLWADYHIKALDAYKAEGVNFWGLTTGNEPITLFMVKFYPAVVMFPEEQREWIINSLGPALEKSLHKTKLILLDDFRIYATWWMNTIMKEPKARKYIHGIGLHWYADVIISPKMLDEVHEKYPSQEIMYTESSINVGFKASLNKNGEVSMIMPEMNNHTLQRPILGSWERAGYYANNIIENLNHWVTLYIDWNLALDLKGGPVTTNGHCDASVIVNNATDEFYKQPIYYVMGHFSKFMFPGSVVIDVHSNNDDVNRQHLLKNNIMSDEEKTTTQRPRPTLPVDMHVQHAAVLNPDGSHTLTFYNPKSHGVEIAVHDPVRGYAFLVLEANSINTIIYW